MPPTLDLSRRSHTKVVVSPPRINLRRAASYNHDRGPLSSTSSRFNFNHLVFSPPPSPGLPSLSPPLKKANRGLCGGITPLRLARYAIRISSIFLVFYVSLVFFTWLFGEPVTTPPQTVPQPPVVKPLSGTVDQVSMVSQKDPPDFPTPIVITDHRGRAKWTVSIPAGSGFPLTMSQYADMCVRCHQVASRARQLRSEGIGLQHMSLGFSDATDHGFIDVQEAQTAGYLPSPTARVGVVREEGTEKPVCKKSLTFVLESNDAGLGKTLMMLWTAYGLAQEEGRAFFIDDTRWSYGKYTAIFQPPPDPDCAAPSGHEILPCPRQARHLVASAATVDVLYDSFIKEFETSSSESHERALRERQFALARQGYEALFRLNKDDGNYVDSRVRDLLAKRIVPKTRGQRHGLAIGVHIRRGDLHPLEYQYRQSYIPLNVYSETARDMIEARLNRTGPFGAEDKAAKAQSFVVVASDDPMTYESAELAGASRAQERIQLASKQAIQQKATGTNPPDRSVMHKFVDETFGWEGGFFAAMFWNLGTSSRRPTAASASSQAVAGGAVSASASSLPAPTAETLRLRSLVGRAYMMDLAVLADASDVVVCAVSAVGCRLLAVMMGWESAMEDGNWVNVDGGYGWMGLEW